MKEFNLSIFIEDNVFKNQFTFIQCILRIFASAISNAMLITIFLLLEDPQ